MEIPRTRGLSAAATVRGTAVMLAPAGGSAGGTTAITLDFPVRYIRLRDWTANPDPHESCTRRVEILSAAHAAGALPLALAATGGTAGAQSS